jgi:hypothetical protein
MFGIEWLKGQSVVEREVSALREQAEVIASAKRRAPDVASNHPGNEPDRFRLNDATGKEIGIFPL